MKVKVRSFRGIRNDAMCEDCDWDYSIHGNADGLNEIRKHIRKTGHRVCRVYGSEFLYEPDLKEKEVK